MIDGQLELSLTNARGCRPLSRRQRHLSRAQWWFDRMRQAVDRALDWAPTPLPRPEQILLPNTYRQPLEASAPKTPPTSVQERQICE